MVEKPFAGDLAGADAMIEAVVGRGRELAVNWPLAWYPSHRTLRRLIADGVLGEIVELHFYDGNRGPLFHEHGKRALDGTDRGAARRQLVLPPRRRRRRDARLPRLRRDARHLVPRRPHRRST